jgi:hypothetical protein
MLASVVLGFDGYDVPMHVMEKEYIRTTPANPYLIEWIKNTQKKSKYTKSINRKG